jgi:hypothetical protein
MSFFQGIIQRPPGLDNASSTLLACICLRGTQPECLSFMCMIHIKSWVPTLCIGEVGCFYMAYLKYYDYDYDLSYTTVSIPAPQRALAARTMWSLKLSIQKTVPWRAELKAVHYRVGL